MRQPTGPEWNTSKEHENYIKPKFYVRGGAVVPPLQHVKHLPAEKRDDIINAWSSKKGPNRMKASM